MLNYDFLNLSPIEFEDFTRDILQQHLGIYLESFKQGKDNGIDLRYTCDEQHTHIFQCKRYTDFKSLISNLKKEVPKVKQLNPKKYLIVTSVGLSPSNKEEIKSLFEPFIKSPADIYGKENLNNLLGKYPEIEKKYYKLWLSSMSIFQKIINNHVVNRSDFLKETILDEIKIFVQNEGFNKAIKQLNAHNFVIISGNPGVGKTTLAKMLVYQLMIKGYELIEVSPDIEDGFRFSSSSKKQVFYYDDFLGRNFLEQTIAKNEDKRLYNFIELIKKSKDKKLIMTTREYILNQAKQKFDLLDREEIDMGKFIIDLASYNNLVKAEILYNHLFFSNLPREYLSYLIRDKNYKKIIEHPNYNPRVIESMTFKINKDLISPQDYYQQFMENLKNPEQIWRHTFENQISDLSKCLLYIVLITKESITEHALMRSLNSLIKEDPILYYSPLNRFKLYKSLKELEDTFIKISKTRDGEQAIISFQNPSVKDFLLNYIKDDKYLIKSILNSIVYFNQLFTIFGIEQNDSFFIKNSVQSRNLDNDLRKIIEEKIISNFDNLEYYSIYQGYNNDSYNNFRKVTYLNNHYDYNNKVINNLIAEKIAGIDLYELDGWDDKEIFVDIIRNVSDNITQDVNLLFENFVKNLFYMNDIKALIELKEIYPDGFKNYEENNYTELVDKIKYTIYEEISNAEKNVSVFESMLGEVDEIEKEFKYYREFDNVRDELYEELDELLNEGHRDDVLGTYSRDNSTKDEGDSERIERMFDSLLDS